jgi:hypothetical protein
MRDGQLALIRSDERLGEASVHQDDALHIHDGRLSLAAHAAARLSLLETFLEPP